MRRCEDGVRRGVRRAEEADKWREKAADREKWKGVSSGAGEKYTN